MQPDLSVARVVGFHCETPSPFELLKDLAAPDLSSSPCTTRQKLPESPLGRMLRSDRPTGFPKLTLKSLGKPGSSSAGHLGLNLSRRAFSAAPGEVLTPVTPSCSRLSSSSEPIPIPEYCRPFRTESQSVAALSGGWPDSSSSRYFAGGNHAGPLEAEHSSLQPESRPLAAYRAQLCGDSADFEPTTPCRPEVLTRQRSALGLNNSTAAALQLPSSAAKVVRDQHLNQLEACVVKQSKSIWELQGKLHEVKRQRDALLLQLEGRPEKTMRSGEAIDESEFLLAADEDLGCWQQHELHSAEHGPNCEALLCSH